MIYVGSAEDTRYDQVLEEVDVGPIPIGVNKFVLTAGTYMGKYANELEDDGVLRVGVRGSYSSSSMEANLCG